jgi:hypothetical protein
MKTHLKILVLYLAFLAFISCRKRIENSVEQPAPVQNNYQNKVAAITKEVAQVLEEVYADNSACNEVNAAIFSGFYADERVALRDLLFPGNSELYRFDGFTKYKVDTGIFRRKFCEIVERGKYPLLSAELKPAKISKPLTGKASALVIDDDPPSILSGASLVCIYFPYSENFGNAQVFDSLPTNSKLATVLKPTLVYTDRDADAAPGRKPYFCTSEPNKLCYIDVTVNDKYAEIIPTHIVTAGGIIKNETAIEVLKSEQVTRIYHGASRLTRQMDKLISLTGNGGGSEIKVCRINGFLKRTDEQITDFAGDVATLHYTRADIRKKRWKRVFSVWDPNWNYQDIEQIYAVYEDDTQGSKTISGTLTTSVNLPGKLGKVDGEIGFKIGVTSQDEIITQRKVDRKSYLRDGTNDQGWGFITDASDFLPAGKDWPVFDGGAVWSYTFPYRIY